MKKSLVLLVFTLLFIFSLNASDRTEATLSYHGDPYYIFHLPDQYGDEEFGVRFTPAAACSLSSAKFLFYDTVGTPTGITVHVYNASNNEPSTELGSLNVPIGDLSFYPDWTIIDLTSLNLTFGANEDFFITYTVNGGAYNSTEVRIITDDGSGSANRAIERNGTTWGYMVNDWGGDYEFCIEAVVNYAEEPAPNLQITPDSVAFGKTAIGGKKMQNVTLTNIGGGMVIINGVSLFGGAQFTLSDNNTYPDTLHNTDAISFTVVYTPDTASNHTATINIDETSVASRTTHHVPVTGEGYNHNSWATPTPIYDQSPTGNQGDYSWSAGTSDAAPGYLRADNFTGLTSSITGVEFWGINWYYDNGWHVSDVEDPMSFDIKFYNNAAIGYGPGALVDSFYVTLNRTTVDSVTFSGEPVYMYHANLSHSVTLSEGWMSIQGKTVSSPNDPWFLWVDSPIGDAYSTMSTDGGSSWDTVTPDYSFALYTETILPPSDVTISISGTNSVISWTSQSGYNYNIYSDTDPFGSFGTLLGTVTDGSGTYTDPVGTATKKFYKVTSVTTTRTAQPHFNTPIIKIVNKKPITIENYSKLIIIK